MMERLKYMREALISCVEKELGNLLEADSKELGEAIDMIKDLEETIYYSTINRDYHKPKVLKISKGTYYKYRNAEDKDYYNYFPQIGYSINYQTQFNSLSSHTKKTVTMGNTLILVSILLLMVAAFFLLRRFGKGGEVAEEHHDHGGSEGGCCGRHANCEKDLDGKNLYFDDEELDRFKGVAPEEYVDSDKEEFRHVLYTMKEDEVDTWVLCLQTRGIELPEDVKEEVLMILRR